MWGDEPVPSELITWIEGRFGGRVSAAAPLARWRAGWFIDVTTADGQVRELYARGARGPDFPSPFSLAHEVAVHELLGAHRFPVPSAYGLCELADTTVLVMDRVPGVQGLASEPDEAVRRRLMLDCVGHIARMHSIPMDDLESRGFDVPQTAHDIVWSEAISRLEGHYLASVHPPDPVIEFLRLWLRRNEPAGRTKPAFVTWDAAQFLHHQRQLTALIDFELAHVGDPYMDLAPLRSRDTMEPFGDLAGAFAHYEALTGALIDFDAVRYFEVAQLAATLMLQRPVVLDPDPNSDLMTHIVWYVESARYALDVIAELHRMPLDTIDAIESPVAGYPAHTHLVRSLHAAARRKLSESAGPADIAYRWRARCDYRLARHLERLAAIGSAVEAAELADVAGLLGASPGNTVAADAALVELIRCAPAERDREIVGYLNRRLQRASMLLGPADALLTQHVPLQPLPDRMPRL